MLRQLITNVRPRGADEENRAGALQGHPRSELVKGEAILPSWKSCN